MSELPVRSSTASVHAERIVRHAPIDRWLHWLTAACVLILLLTALLPVLGVEFAWVAIHWAAGGVLIVLVVLHIVRVLVRRSWREVWIGGRDFREAVGIVARTLRISKAPAVKPGKYSFAQKFIHFAFAVVVLAACVTGGLMMVKTDTPWWDRNPYWLSDPAWGIVYVIHGFSALLLVTMIMCHVYFAFRPEKRRFLRAMLVGWITRDEHARHHDAARWRV